MENEYEMTYSGLIRSKENGGMLYLKTDTIAKKLAHRLSKHYGKHWQIRKRKLNLLHPFQYRYYVIFDLWKD